MFNLPDFYNTQEVKPVEQSTGPIIEYSGPIPTFENYPGSVPTYVTPVFKREGTKMLDGFIYVLGTNQTINGVPLNSPILSLSNDTLYYQEGANWILFQGRIKTTIEHAVTPQPSQPNSVAPNGVTPFQSGGDFVLDGDVIKQVAQNQDRDREVDVSQLIMQKQLMKGTLFDNPLMLAGLAGIGFWVYKLTTNKN